MNTSIARLSIATLELEDEIQAFDWVLPIWGWPQIETPADVPSMMDPIEFESDIESIEDGHFTRHGAVDETRSNADTRSDDTEIGWPLATTRASSDRAETTLHAATVFNDEPLSAPARGTAWAPQVAVAQPAPITQSRDGGIFGLDGDTAAVGTARDDVFYEVKYYANDNMPNGWATQRSLFDGRDGDDIFYTVDGLGYRGQNTDYGMEIFDGGRGTDTVSYFGPIPVPPSISKRGSATGSARTGLIQTSTWWSVMRWFPSRTPPGRSTPTASAGTGKTIFCMGLAGTM